MFISSTIHVHVHMRAMIEYLDYISSVAVHILVFLLGMMLLKQVVTSCCTFITTASSMNFNFAASHTCSLAHRKQVHVHVVEDGDNNNNVVTVFDSLLSPSQSKSTGQHSNHTLSHARHIVVTVLSYRYTKDVCIFVMLYLWLKHVIFRRIDWSEDEDEDGEWLKL